MKQQKIEQPQQVPPSYMVQQPWYPPEDEISLLDLWRVLVKQKQVIAGVTAIAVVVALLYALSVAPVYQAETHFLPPQAKEIQSLNVQGVQGVQGVSVDAVYSAYQRNLGSSRLQRQYFEQEGIRQLVEVDEASGNSDEQVFESFSRQLKINSSKKNKSALSLSVEWGDAETAARIANEYSALVDRETVKEFASNLRNAVSNRVRDIEYTIASKRKMAKQRRKDKVSQLVEADRIQQEYLEEKIVLLKAHALTDREDRIARLQEADLIKRANIQEKISLLQESAAKRRADRIAMLQENLKMAKQLGIDQAVSSTSQVGSAQIEINTSSIPLYMYGVERLEVEIDVLKSRTTDAPFIAELRGLQQQLINLDLNNEIIALQQRSNDAPFIAELRKLEQQLKALKSNKEVGVLQQRTNDDPFISGLRDLQEELTRLQSVKIDESGLHAATIDRKAYAPEHRIKPKRKLIVVLGMVLGFMLGIFLAFFRNFLDNQRKEVEDDAKVISENL